MGSSTSIEKYFELPWPLKKALVYGRLWPEFVSRVGPFSGMVILGKIIARRSGIFSTDCPKGGKLNLRANTADIDSYVKVFIQGEYEVDIGFEPGTILDAGAHIGCSAAYFARRWPKARIFAVEPIEDNFSLLQTNVGSLPNVTVIDAAVWHESGRISFDNPHGRTDSYMVSTESGESDGIPAVTVDELSRSASISGFDLVKLDIEGTEREIFTRDSSWLSRIRCLIVELHDRMAPGCTEALTKALEPYDYNMCVRGENVVIRDIQKKATVSGLPHR